MRSVKGPIMGDYTPGHTLRCCAPAMGRSERAAMPQNRVRCAAIES